jgi:hypothetical protein
MADRDPWRVVVFFDDATAGPHRNRRRCLRFRSLAAAELQGRRIRFEGFSFTAKAGEVHIPTHRIIKVLVERHG